jgi:hypothetical protein
MTRSALAIATAAALAGCAGQRPATVGAPTTVAAREQIHAAQSSARGAGDAIRATGESNERISGDLRAIDDKAVRAIRWLRGHKPKG